MLAPRHALVVFRASGTFRYVSVVVSIRELAYLPDLQLPPDY